MTEKSEPLVAGENDDGIRLDRAVRRLLPRVPLAGVYRLIRRGRVRVNGRKAGLAYRLKPGDRIDLDKAAEPIGKPASVKQQSPSSRRNEQKLKSMILFRSEHLLALNKPYGLLVHGKDSLASLMAGAGITDAAPALSFRPGPVHRLDRNTTGVLLWSLSLHGARTLSRLFREHLVVKVYCALLDGRIEQPAEWEDDLARDQTKKKTERMAAADGAGFFAATSIIPIFHKNDVSLVFLKPKTGRTHQLRAQASLRGHPLAGDRKYGGSPGWSRYFLHSLGLATSSPEMPLGPLIAPFDAFELETLESFFGKYAGETVYERARTLLSDGM